MLKNILDNNSRKYCYLKEKYIFKIYFFRCRIVFSISKIKIIVILNSVLYIKIFLVAALKSDGNRIIFHQWILYKIEN